MGLVLVQFLVSYRCYNPGEVAGFDEAVANELCNELKRDDGTRRPPVAKKVVPKVEAVARPVVAKTPLVRTKKY